MSRYKLRANYDIENIDSQKMDGTVIVDVPMPVSYTHLRAHET